MGTPLINVLMPVYNGELYLRAAVDSVLSQSHRDFELIIVDDGSTDGTPTILSQYRDSRIRVLHIEHAGLIGALNTGLTQCHAPFLARMDADDLSYPDRFEKQLNCLTQHPDVTVVTCWCDLLDERGAVVGRRTGGLAADMILQLASGNPIVHGSVMIRRDRLPHPVYTSPPEDYWLWVQLARAGERFYCLPDVLYGFRTHRERYSLRHFRSQSAGLVAVQWPLLVECSATRDQADLQVRDRLVRGWGGVAGAAYCCGDRQRGNEARQRFLELAGNRWNDLAPAIRYGIESMIWGGCPWADQWQLRWRQWGHEPADWRSYRNLILCLPPIQWLQRTFRRTR